MTGIGTGGTPEVVTVGETMAVLAPDPGVSLTDAERVTLGVGGAESNLAATLAALGHRVAWVSRVGNDPFGRRILRRLATDGVDIDLVDVDPVAPTGLYVKEPGSDGTRAHYYRTGSAASRLSTDVLRRPRLTGARLLHLTGITAGLSPSCLRLVEHAMTDRPLAGAIVSFDVNYRPRLWQDRMAGDLLLRLADAADVVFVGLDEARTIWGAVDPAEVRRLLPGPATVVVKDAAVGATALPRHGPATFVPALRVPVVEPVGAGDAFAAGYLSALLRGLGEVASLRLGHLLAARVLAVPGDNAAPPDQDRLAALMTLPDHEWSTLTGV
ncbi:sugar kinase [Plantactinospora sp. GCM10030261]|uniref:sugar kinase n=1 Tax=Plantactinospora sp. GCM10030261 TaxID=3273420 RepID=UPI00361CEAEC